MEDYTFRHGTFAEFVDLVYENHRQSEKAFELPRETIEAMAEGLHSECDIFILAENDGQVVGGVSAATDGLLGRDQPVLDSVHVLPSHRRKGLATQLAKLAIAVLNTVGNGPFYCSASTPVGNLFLIALFLPFPSHLSTAALNTTSFVIRYRYT